MKVALLLCVIAALGYGVAAVLQALGAHQAGAKGRIGLIRTAQQPLFLLGVLLDLFSWVISRFALHTLPLFAVQTILAGSLAVTVLLARVALKSELRRTDQLAVAMTMAGLVLVGVAAGEDTAHGLTASLKVGVLIGVPAVAVAGVAIIKLARPTLLAVLAGVAFTGSALAARTVKTSDISARGVFSEPLLWAVLIYAVMALVFHAVALMQGNVGAVTSAMWATEVVVATVIGALLLDDHMRPGWQIPAIVGIGLTLIATVVLSRSPAQNLEHRLPARPPVPEGATSPSPQ
jgi:drug/metabolite transporter (DMT)-like permease